MTPESRTDGSSRHTLRVGRIEFVNCFPLYHHFEEELEASGVSAAIVEGHPAALNGMLVDGAIDVALPSSIAFARAADRLTLLPHVSISSFGAVDSVQLFTRAPLPDVRRIALTEKSATSICLLKVLCREWGVAPEFVPRRGSARRGAGVAATACCSSATTRCTCCAPRSTRTTTTSARSGSASPACPWCIAVCAARREFVAARPAAAAAVGAALLASRDAAPPTRPRRPPQAALRYDFSQRYLMGYFDKLKFGFTPEYRAGLEEFYRRAAAIGELERVPDVSMVSDAV